MPTAHRLSQARARARRWYRDNKVRKLAYDRQYCARNVERVRLYKSKHVRKNRPYYTAKLARYRALKLRATPAWADHLKIAAIYAEAARSGMHVDHIVPLRSLIVCGLHVEHNLQLLPATLNWQKSNLVWPDMP